ncbi:MAG: TIR domain-containing protein [Sphingomonas sp.]|nr:TIR domain-containing protein [Sphingomonas sp.]
MSEVFVSYARPDEPLAQQVGAALRALGHEVWCDDQLPAHRAYSEVIEERLKAAKAVVVLWSAEAAKSQWVRAEADSARTAGTLIQASIDGCAPPLPFNQIQCADLKDWDGKADTPGWRKLIGSVTTLAGAAVLAATAKPRARSVCVLPFANMSGEAEQEYFSDGISEDITTDLSKVSALTVTARNTAFQFKGQSIDVREVARQLAVSHVLEGSVRKAGGRVRITAQLIDGASGDHVWAERYDRDLTDIFAIQDELSKAIVEALKVKLLPEEKSAIAERGTSNVDAYNLYLMARQQWMTGTHGETRREESVIRLCDRIIDMDPGYGRAWALKALAQVTLHFGYKVGKDDGVATADRALELDPTLAEAFSVKARAALGRRDFAAAEKEIQAALNLAPESWEVNKEAAGLYIWRHDFVKAAGYYEKCVSLFPEDLHSWDMLLMAYRAMGDSSAQVRTAEQQLANAQAIVRREPQNYYAYARGANALVMLGDLPKAKDWIGRALLIAPENLDIRYNFACTLFTNPETHELGLDHLEYVFGRSVGSIIRRADLDTDLDPVRDHRRFQQIYAAGIERISQGDGKAETETSRSTGAGR